jgi:hypothetical protein
MNKYNLLKDEKLIADGSSVTTANGLQTDYFDVVAGENSVTIPGMIGANISLLFREGEPYELVTGTPGAKEFTHNSTTGELVFYSGMTFNSGERLIISYTTTGGATSTEPMTVQEVKDYLRLEGFIDDIESPSSDYDDDDTLIGELITSARQRLEAFTGLSFIPKTYQIEICNLAGDFVIPYGPVTEIVSVEDTSGTALAYTTTINLSKLKTPVQDDIVIEYVCGYAVLPKGLKEAMLKEIAYRYTNRGDEVTAALCAQAINLASPFKEAGTWLG